MRRQQKSPAQAKLERGTLVLGMRDRPGLMEERAASPSVLRRYVHGVEAVCRSGRVAHSSPILG